MPWVQALGAGVQLLLLAFGALSFPVTFVGWWMARPYEEAWWLNAMAVVTVIAVLTGGSRSLIFALVGVVGWWGFHWAPALIVFAALGALGLPFMLLVALAGYLASRRAGP